jgi:hypothetical protein
MIQPEVSLSTMFPQTESELQLIESNESSASPTFHTVEYMLLIECRNLLFNVLPRAKQIWKVEDYIGYLFGKSILDVSRADVKYDTTSKKIKQCDEKKEDSPQCRTFKRLMKILLLYTTSNVQHL